jgi:hypothetical protein
MSLNDVSVTKAGPDGTTVKDVPVIIMIPICVRFPRPDYRFVLKAVRDAVRAWGLVDAEDSDDFIDEMRTPEEILIAEEQYFEKLWYSRHREFHTADMRKPTYDPRKWKEAIANAEAIEKKYPKAELPPWDDFEYGMVCGKLSALRWVLGDEWGMLDT